VKFALYFLMNGSGVSRPIPRLRAVFSAFASAVPTKTATTLLPIYANGGYVSISGVRIVLDDPVSSRSSAKMESIHFT
jgi:hypothetical protein